MSLIQDIFNHKMILPDMADIPECADLEKVEKDSRRWRRLLKGFDSSIENRSVKEFRNNLKSLNDLTYRFYKYTKEEGAIKEAQYAIVSKMATQYISDLKRKDDFSPNGSYASTPYENLCNNGYFSTRLDPTSKEKLKLFLSPYIDNLQKQPDSDHSTPGSGYDRHHKFKPNPSNAELIGILDDFYKKNTLYEASQVYYACGKLKIKAVTLHVCSPSDTHYYQTLKDCKTSSSLIGMHFDPKAVMKTIIYLNDVDEDSGPFSVVPSTNRWHFDHIEKIFAKGNSIGNYLNSPAHRRVALRAPYRLRKNAIFGRFVPDGTKLSKKLLSLEKKFVSEECDFILFDPANTFHRGGICKSKQRINLQVILSTK
tara:strand:+ start:2764 stop:3870 length:1107 start_codon:yes stop_codon:yes gene_type:complete